MFTISSKMFIKAVRPLFKSCCVFARDIIVIRYFVTVNNPSDQSLPVYVINIL